MSTKETLGEKDFDVRLLDKAIADGRLTQKELADYLNNLPDDSDKAQKVE